MQAYMEVKTSYNRDIVTRFSESTMKIETGSVYTIQYMAKTGEVTQRTVKVIAVKPQGFLTECQRKKEVRMFRYDRILKIWNTSGIYKGEWGFTGYGPDANEEAA